MKPAAGYLLLIAAAILLFSAGCSHEISVTRVGSRDRLGYGSVRQFSFIFRKLSGRLPSEYRFCCS